MMKMIFDFECEEGHVTELLVNSDVRELPCPVCNKVSTRVISPIKTVFKGHGWVDKDLKWARDHEKAAQPKQQ